MKLPRDRTGAQLEAQKDPRPDEESSVRNVTSSSTSLVSNDGSPRRPDTFPGNVGGASPARRSRSERMFRPSRGLKARPLEDLCGPMDGLSEVRY